MPKLQAYELKIAQVFADEKQYFVPKYQREFSWTNDEVDKFIEDIYDVIDREQKEYFVGPMVFIEQEDSRYTIVDGQQRLTTSAILICAVRDILFEIGDDEGATKLDKFVKEENLINKIEFNRITLSKDNNEFFSTVILTIGKASEKSNHRGKLSVTNKRILSTYQAFCGKFNKKMEIFQTEEEKQRYLREIVYKFLHAFTIIGIFVDSDSEAYRIFETLNDRGLELSISDLVKNYVLQNSGAVNEDKIYERWGQINTKLKEVQFDKFLRYYWLALHEHVNKEELFDRIKNEIKSVKQVEEFTQSLLDYVPIYKALVDPDVERDWWWDDEEIIQELQDLATLSSSVCYPPLLVARKMWDDKQEFLKLIKLCVNFFFRTKTIGDGHASALEKFMTDIAYQIKENYAKSDQIRELLVKYGDYPSDPDFKKLFSVATVKHSGIARYILVKLNQEYSGGAKYAEMKPISKITVEHILPQTLTPEWESYLKKHNMDHTTLVNRIGNLTLLKKEKNTEAYNNNFDKKKTEIYAQSQIMITKLLTDVKEWDETKITKRQEDFAEKAATIWKV